MRRMAQVDPQCDRIWFDTSWTRPHVSPLLFGHRHRCLGSGLCAHRKARRTHILGTLMRGFSASAAFRNATSRPQRRHHTSLRHRSAPPPARLRVILSPRGPRLRSTELFLASSSLTWTPTLPPALIPVRESFAFEGCGKESYEFYESDCQGRTSSSLIAFRLFPLQSAPTDRFATIVSTRGWAVQSFASDSSCCFRWSSMRRFQARCRSPFGVAWFYLRLTLATMTHVAWRFFWSSERACG